VQQCVLCNCLSNNEVALGVDHSLIHLCLGTWHFLMLAAPPEMDPRHAWIITKLQVSAQAASSHNTRNNTWHCLPHTPCTPHTRADKTRAVAHDNSLTAAAIAIICALSTHSHSPSPSHSHSQTNASQETFGERLSSPRVDDFLCHEDSARALDVFLCGQSPCLVV
jgi:hypothetical protein